MSPPNPFIYNFFRETPPISIYYYLSPTPRLSTSDKAPKIIFSNKYLFIELYHTNFLFMSSKYVQLGHVLFYSSGSSTLAIRYVQGPTNYIAKPYSASCHWLTSHRSIGYTSETNILSYHSTKQWLNLRTERRH